MISNILFESLTHSQIKSGSLLTAFSLLGNIDIGADE